MLQEIMQFINQHMTLSLIWIALLVAVIVTTMKSLFSKTKEITRAQAINLINKEEAIVVDLRSREDFRKGHIIGSINLTPSEIKDNNLAELEKHKEQPVIVVSANGTESRTPAENLLRAGFERVCSLKEGLAGWTGENLPLARGKK
ncbi:rhodanese-like domain-containing protein [Photorhabdus temperata subsp. temperata]